LVKNKEIAAKIKRDCLGGRAKFRALPVRVD
jgi:hypothetical protein